MNSAPRPRRTARQIQLASLEQVLADRIASLNSLHTAGLPTRGATAAVQAVRTEIAELGMVAS